MYLIREVMRNTAIVSMQCKDLASICQLNEKPKWRCSIHAIVSVRPSFISTPNYAMIGMINELFVHCGYLDIRHVCMDDFL